MRRAVACRSDRDTFSYTLVFTPKRFPAHPSDRRERDANACLHATAQINAIEFNATETVASGGVPEWRRAGAVHLFLEEYSTVVFLESRLVAMRNGLWKKLNTCPFFRDSFSSHAERFVLLVSRLCASRVERGRVTEKTGNVNPVVRDRSNIGLASINRASRSTIPCRDGDSLGALAKKQSAGRARTRACVGLGGRLVDAGTPLFLDARFCVSRSRGSYRRRG